MLAASALASRSGVRMVANSVAEPLSYHLVPFHPVLCQASRRWYQSTAFLSSNKSAMLKAQPDRWLLCKARLYARHLLTVAALNAATLKHKTRLEEAHIKPEEWANWSRKEWSDELLASIGSSRLARLWSATSRLCQLAILTAPLVVLMPASCVSTKATDWSWSYALWGIEQAGPTFIKLTQWATTRQDLFSPEFCQYFGIA